MAVSTMPEYAAQVSLAKQARKLLDMIRDANGGHCPASVAGGVPVDAQPQDKTPELQAGAAVESEGSAAGADKMTWQDAQAELEALRLKGEGFTSRRKMGHRIGCSGFLVQKAIDKGPVELQEWATKERGASKLNAAPEVAAVTFDSTPQGRESDPADMLQEDDVNTALAYLLNQAGPDERARINALTPAERRRLAETVYRDPDKEEQIDRQRRAKRLRRD